MYATKSVINKGRRTVKMLLRKYENVGVIIKKKVIFKNIELNTASAHDILVLRFSIVFFKKILLPKKKLILLKCLCSYINLIISVKNGLHEAYGPYWEKINDSDVIFIFKV